ncbi:aminodeoxychorismate lyase [Reinekea sp.]|jgi:4-amino-4-deoxychorismate lyase|uniref:aminodeoxychorismate lyase n=1 Tax=Reinekea sp. TaxID=1970455 RepID=UPI002A83EA6D|nr:aminodeoxychorismate lyase [Reinekea sp.]
MHISLFNGTNGAIPLSHRALAYGDGLFETLLADRRGPHWLAAHLDRLYAGTCRLGMAWSMAQNLALKEQLEALCADLDGPHLIKVMLLRNNPAHGYDFDPLLQQTDVLLQCSPYQRPDWTEQGARVGLSGSHVSRNSTLAGMKHLNRLDSVLARQSARRQGVDEVLMTTDNGTIIEGSLANVFFYRQGRWSTPAVDQAGVAGVMREQLLQRFAQIAVSGTEVDNIDQIESAFLSNSLMGLVPVRCLMGRTLAIHADIQTFNSELSNQW